MWAFSPENRRAAFWPRRMAQETTIHRVDAEQAAGLPVGAIEPAFAVDGIDELLAIFVQVFGAARSPGDDRTVHVHATDTEGEWLIRFEPDAVIVGERSRQRDAAVRGPAAELLLWLWGRRPLDGLGCSASVPRPTQLRAVTTI